MTTRADVVAMARTQLGVKWQHQAALMNVALDCIGLVGCVGVALGLPDAIAWAADPAVKGYATTPDARVLIAACEKYLDSIPIAQAGLGDILVMRFPVDPPAQSEPQHFAIVSRLNPMYVVHSYKTARMVAENGIDGEYKTGVTWRSLIHSAWRFRGLTDG